MAAPVVGIDLGTSRSSVAVVINGTPVPLPDAEGRVDHPSVVYFPADGEPVVGHDALPYLVEDPANTVFAVKRLIGRAWHDPEVKRAVAVRPYKVVKGEGAFPLVEVRGKTLTPSQVSAKVLVHLKRIAEARLGRPVHRAVVAVPANFNDAQREATRVAAWLAGLEIIRLVNEPTAAAFSIRPALRDGKFLIYDFGGGTFDVTVLERGGDVFRVLATQGDMALGGDDMDRALAERVRSTFLAQEGVDLHDNPLTWATLLQVCERNKIALCTTDEMPLRLNNVARRNNQPLHLNIQMDRAFLSDTVAPLIEQSLAVTRGALDQAHVPASELDGVILVGGTSQLLAVRQQTEKSLGKTSVQGVHPTAAVALGAAALASLVTEGLGVKDAGLLLDVLPMSLGIAGPDGAFIPMVARNSPMPAHARTVVKTTRDGQAQLTIEVLQGESTRAVDNVQLGLLQVGNLPMGDAGATSVEVLVEMDTDGVLHVAAVDLQTGRVHGGFTRTLSGMTEQDIEMLRQKARSA